MGTFRLTLSRLRVGRNYLTLAAEQLSAGSITSRHAFGTRCDPNGPGELLSPKVGGNWFSLRE